MKEVRSLLQNIVNNDIYVLTGARLSSSTTSLLGIKRKVVKVIKYVLNNIINILDNCLSLISKDLAISYS